MSDFLTPKNKKLSLIEKTDISEKKTKFSQNIDKSKNNV